MLQMGKNALSKSRTVLEYSGGMIILITIVNFCVLRFLRIFDIVILTCCCKSSGHWSFFTEFNYISISSQICAFTILTFLLQSLSRKLSIVETFYKKGKKPNLSTCRSWFKKKCFFEVYFVQIGSFQHDPQHNFTVIKLALSPNKHLTNSTKKLLTTNNWLQNFFQKKF